MNNDKVREVLAKRLWPKADAGLIAVSCAFWAEGKTCWTDEGRRYREVRDPLQSHDTIHAVEATLSDEEWGQYMDAILRRYQGFIEGCPRDTRLQSWERRIRHAPARTLANALAIVTGGEDE